MAKFMYNNHKNDSTSYMSFESNSDYHHCVSFDKNINPCSWLKTAKKLSAKLRKLITIYQKNFYYTQKL